MSNIVDFENIGKHLPNGQNMGGLPQVVFYGSYEDVAKWPQRPVPGAGMTIARMGELTGSVEMKEGKFMHRLYVTDGEGKLDIEGVGEVDGKSYVMKLRVYQPGLQSRLLGFINRVKNDNLVFIVPDSNGNLFLLGDEKRAAILDSIDGMTTGQKTEERPGAGLVFAYKTANVYQYKGAIPLKEGGGVVPDPGPDPEPGPNPNLTMACCPDGINDHFTITSQSLLFSSLVPGSGKELIYTIDLTDANGTIFSFGVKDMYAISLIYSGSFTMLLYYDGSKTMGAYQEMSVDNGGKRVLLKLVSSAQGVHMYVNGIEEPLTFADVSADMPRIPATDFFYLFRDNSESEPNYGASKILSFSIDEKAGATLTPLVLWNFTGDNSAERLKNKVAGKSEFDLVAQDVLNIDEVIKGIDVEDLPEQAPGEVPTPDPTPDPAPDMTMMCCPDGVDDYLTVGVSAISKIGLFPVNGQKMIYTMDMLPGGMVFYFEIANNLLISFVHSGTDITIAIYCNGKAFVKMGEAVINCVARRVVMRFEVVISDNVPLAKLFIDGTEELVELAEMEGFMPSGSDSFYLFALPPDSYFSGKLYSLSVEKSNVDNTNVTPVALWNFKGTGDAERLKNKVNNGYYHLTAHNVTDMNEFIKQATE